tara:strand:+ start:2889 stop:3272 length:384 start_codon:yes stop_codon:yes gene_type:complete
MKNYGKIENGKLILENEEKFNKSLKYFEGKNIVLKIREVEMQRTIEQNSLYWVWIDILASELGYQKNEMNQLIKYKFLKKDVVNEKGQKEVRLMSTTTLSKKEFSQLMENIYFWSNDTFNIVLPKNE